MNDEDALIERLTRRLAPSRRVGGGLVLGIGDDAAIVRSGGRFDWAVSADFTLEGVHFAGGDAPESVGYRALARATSDLGAMGARPAYYLLALALPKARAGRWLDRMLAGMARAARRYGLRLAGGDTTRMAQALIAVTVIGRNRRGGAVRRSGARAGDRIFVSGRLGAAAAGLAVKRERLEGNPRYRPLVRQLLYPTIPLELGIWLAERRLASAMIDLSDGLSSDLARLARSSGVGARIFLDRLPAVPVPAALARRGLDREKLALDGGEDYGLLFTAHPAEAANVPRAFRGIRITRIGEVTAAGSIELVDANGRRRRLRPAGWDPFRAKA